MIEYVAYIIIGLVLTVTTYCVYNGWREQSRFHKFMKEMDKLVLDTIRNLDREKR